MGDDLLRKYAGAGAEGAGYTVEQQTNVERGVDEGVEEREAEASATPPAVVEKPGILERLKRLINAD